VPLPAILLLGWWMLFVDAIYLKSFGFAHVECQEEGRPPFHPSVLLKLYLYGYRYGIRTSRKLEREARTNMEAMWLPFRTSSKVQNYCRLPKKPFQSF
jgi:hypothetical protein